jgi:hypothetical protein
MKCGISAYSEIISVTLRLSKIIMQCPINKKTPYKQKNSILHLKIRMYRKEHYEVKAPDMHLKQSRTEPQINRVNPGHSARKISCLKS